MASDQRFMRSKLRDTVIQLGRVLDVNIDRYTVSVTTEFAKKPFTDISFATPYQHYANGEGIYFMPEVGSFCWICMPSDGKRPFVLAWAAASSRIDPAKEKVDHTANKMQLNPGDIYMGTRDENFLILRRGGVVQIGGGPLSQRMFLPIQNTIRDLCENYSLQTLGGQLVWAVGRTEDTTDGKIPATLLIEARQFSNDKNPVAVLTVGSHGSDSGPILMLSVKASPDDNADVNISLSMTKAGKVEWNVKDDFVFAGKGAYTITTEKEYSVTSTGAMTLESKDAASLKAALELKLEGGTTATVKGATAVSLDAPQIKLGGDSATHGVVFQEILDWLKAHTHNTIVMGSPTSPPLTAAALLPGTFCSLTVKSK